jgi:hypothetical protein
MPAEAPLVELRAIVVAKEETAFTTAVPYEPSKEPV